MTFPGKYDKILTGIILGLVLPFFVGLLIYIFSPGHLVLWSYLARFAGSDNLTHAITLCVFPNFIIFLVFSRFDMLRASRGVLAVTIAWAVILFAVKFLI
jgi:hypothetical protein